MDGEESKMMDEMNEGGVAVGTSAPVEAGGAGLKVCPRCGASLFADMDVCYACLYDFSRTSPSWSADHDGDDEVPWDYGALLAETDGMGKVQRADPWDDAACWEQVPPEASCAAFPQAAFSPAPEADETVELPVMGGGPSGVGIRVMTPTMDVIEPLSVRGISVGRAEGNDVVLHDSTVSRRHVRLYPSGGGVVVEDQGATNPATVLGYPVRGGSRLAMGDVVDVCGTSLVVVRLDPNR